MSVLGKYLFSVIAVSMLISVSKSFVNPKGVIGSVLNLVCGVLLLSVLLVPIKDIKIYNMNTLYDNIRTEADSAVADGEEFKEVNLSKCIEENLGSYILDKASSLGLDINIQLHLNRDIIPRPVGLTITGDASPYAKKQFLQVVSRDLGLMEENIQWQ